jgi:hypothetical protein
VEGAVSGPVDPHAGVSVVVGGARAHAAQEGAEEGPCRVEGGDGGGGRGGDDGYGGEGWADGATRGPDGAEGGGERWVPSCGATRQKASSSKMQMINALLISFIATASATCGTHCGGCTAPCVNDPTAACFDCGFAPCEDVSGYCWSLWRSRRQLLPIRLYALRHPP